MAKKLRVSEIFGGYDPGSIPVIQGEGKHVGTSSIFVRLFGCNLRCPGFGIPNYPVGYKNKEVESIVENLSNYKTLAELPPVLTGCDTYYSVYPEFKQFSRDYTVNELVAELDDRRHSKYKEPHIVFTGGEPLLWQSVLIDVIKELSMLGHKNVTFETNGTVVLLPTFIAALTESGMSITWSVSPKLLLSGHVRSDTLDSGALRSYNQVPNSSLYLKFVVNSDVTDIKEVLEFIKQYSLDGVDIEDVYLMPEGGRYDERFKKNQRHVIELCVETGFKYSPRLQVEMFDNCIGS